MTQVTNKTSIEALLRPDIRELPVYQSARTLMPKTDGMIFLDANEASFDAVIGGTPVNRYPDQQPKALQDALCRLFDISSRNLVIGRGADEIIDLLIRAFCIPGHDSVLIAPPTFAMYAQSSAVYGAKVVEAPLSPDFRLDVDALCANQDDAKLIFLCSPNNPTGNVMLNGEISAICDANQGRSVIVVDETYIDYSDAAGAMALVEEWDNLIVLRTLSKAYGAAGLRCGMGIAQPRIIEVLRKILAPYPLTEPAVDMAVRLLTTKNLERLSQLRADVVDRRERVAKALRDLPDVEEVFPSEGNFLLARFTDSASVFEKCKQSGILLRDQSRQPGLKNCLRIGIGSEEEMMILLRVLNGEAQRDAPMRTASVRRATSETAIQVTVNLDRTAPIRVNTGVGFFDHMLEQLAKHSGIALELDCAGDLEIDEHHTVEDCAIALGQTLRGALGDKSGIGRYGFTVPMDEASAVVAVDLSGRAFFRFDGDFPETTIGGLPASMIPHIFRSLAENMKMTCHLSVTGENSHHMAEACFKSLGRALRPAFAKDGSVVPSTKGVL